MSQIVLDPGHGGQRDAGRSTAHGADPREPEMTYALCRRVEAVLGGRVALTRAPRENPTLAERIRHGDGSLAFVSVHAHPDCDAGVWVHADAPARSHALAQRLAARLGAPVRSHSLAVLAPDWHRGTACCLVEFPLDRHAGLDDAAHQLASAIREFVDGPAYGSRFALDVTNANQPGAWWTPKAFTDYGATLGARIKDVPATQVPYKLRPNGPVAAPNPATSPFAANRELLEAVGAKIGKIDASAVVFGADKDLAFPFWATKAKRIDIVSTDANAPCQRLVNLISAAGLANLKPAFLDHGAGVSQINVTPRIDAFNYQFRLFDGVYSDFFGADMAAAHQADQYDFMLDKMSYLGMDRLGTGKYLALLANGGHWISDKRLLDTDDSLLLALLGYQDVTSTILTQAQRAKSFGNSTMRIVKNAHGYPQAWREKVGLWFMHVQFVLDGTKFGRGTGMNDVDEDDYRQWYADGRTIYWFLAHSGMPQTVITALEGTLDTLHTEMERVTARANES